MKDLFLAVLSFFAALGIVFLFVALGWYILWVLILSRFKFIRDLLNSVKSTKDPVDHQQKSNRGKVKKIRKD